MSEKLPPKVFISYSHDTNEHADRVLAFSNRLREDGIDTVLDQYEGFPKEGWPRWMDKRIRDADFVLMICTEPYYRRVMGEEEPGKGLGVRWEGNLIYQHLYNAGTVNIRFVPVLFPGTDKSHIPTPVGGATHFLVQQLDLSDSGYRDLYRLLTGQHGTPKPGLGQMKSLPARARNDAFADYMRIRPSLDYQFNATTQVVQALKQQGHDRVHLQEFARFIGDPLLRDGISPLYEPLTLAKVSDALQEMVQKQQLSIQDGYLVIP